MSATPPLAGATPQAPQPPQPQALLFANYLQLPTVLPLRVWLVLRYLCVVLALGVVALLILQPQQGLTLFWMVTVPILPAVFVLTPGVWRNVCPMAALNQAPRLLGFTRGLTHTPLIREYSYVVGIGLFFLLVSSRKWLFDGSGLATGLLILFGLLGAFVGGLVFKGKSGWCSSICPLLPVQRIYAQAPVKQVANAHCRPCVGCTKNCFDFNPGVAYLADQYDSDKRYVGYRRVFAAILPGFILAFYTIPPGSAPLTIYATFGLYGGLSLAIFHLLDTFLKLPNNRLTVLFGAAAFSCYYWFASVTWFSGLSRLTGQWAVPDAGPWLVRATVLVLAAAWIVRNFTKENLFVEHTVNRAASQPVKLGGNAAAALKAAGAAAKASLVILPEKTTFAAQTGQTLLELVEGCGAKIEAGCRMGVCGADPVAVHEGAELLSPIGDDEKNTLQRLGHATNTRMACSARLQGVGCVHIALTPEKAASSSADTTQLFNAAIERIVIVGNGIAGVTAADHVRRKHPQCSIQVVADENHPLYNRMGITRLVYGRSAMQGLHLMPETWYSERNIEVLLNTSAKAIDTHDKKVILAEGEPLPYDRLILATGSSSFVPPLEGWGGDGCFVLRSADDAMGLRAHAQRSGAKHAVVAGGGLLGLEAAYALFKLGLRVTVVERNPWLMNRQLDQRGGNLLQGYLQGLGIHMRLNSRMVRLEKRSDEPQKLVLADGDPVLADVLVVAAGITPNIALPMAAGIQVGKGVLVDAHMATSAPDVYAAGDVVEFANRSLGLWPLAVEQAEVAARNALGESVSYREPVLSTALKVVGADLVSVGDFAGQEMDAIVFEENLAEFRYRKLVVRQGRLVGAILIGWPALIEPVTKAVKSGMDISHALGPIQDGDWSVFNAR